MAQLFVDTDAICRNYVHYSKFGQVIPVLKEDGYGLGAEKLLTLLRDREQARLFACSKTEEAFALTAKGVDIMLLSCEHDMAMLKKLVTENVILSVESLEQARKIQSLEIPARVQIAVDTGLGRFGFLPEKIADIKTLFDMDCLTVFGIFSHLADTGKAAQLDRFQRVLTELEGFPVGLRHIASTHSSEDPKYQLDAVRIGSGLTGLVAGLEPVASLTGRICTVHRQKKGNSVGYSGVKLKRDSDIAIIDVGTGDGAFTYRSCGPRTWLSARKQFVTLGEWKVPVLGYPGLTHTAIDVTGIPCKAGDQVIVKQSPVMVSARVPRRYSDET